MDRILFQLGLVARKLGVTTIQRGAVRHFTTGINPDNSSQRLVETFRQNSKKKFPEPSIGGNKISLMASVPVLPPPPSVAKFLSKSCTHPSSEIIYYRSRSVFGTEDLQKETLKYYQATGINVENCKPLFTPSEHDLIALLAKHLVKNKQSAIMTVPTFGLFFNALERNNVKVNLAKLTEENDWKLTPQILRSILYAPENTNAGLFFFINPDNPTGKTYNKQETGALAQEFLEYNQWREQNNKTPLLLLADEASRRILLDSKAEFCSIATFSGMEKFTVTVSTSSKDLAPGLAISHAIGPKDLIEGLFNAEDPLHADCGPAYPQQYLLARILEGTDEIKFREHLETSIGIYNRNLSMIENAMRDMNSMLEEKFGKNPDGIRFIEVIRPEGGLQCIIKAVGIANLSFPPDYQFLPPPQPIGNSFALTDYFQKTIGVEVLSGEYCGFDGEEMMFRMTISKTPEIIQEALKRMKQALEKLTPAKQLVHEDVLPSPALSPSNSVAVADRASGRESRY